MPMHIVIFGLSITSAWGNGHATPWRGLCRALAKRGHRITFFERDTPYYAAHRDMPEPEGCDVVLYTSWDDVTSDASRRADAADVAIVTSYCPDGRAACALTLESDAKIKAFYDLDTPVSLDRLARGEDVAYFPREGLGGFDVVLSFTGGRALAALAERLDAAVALPLYGSVDPDVHRPLPARTTRPWSLSYLGTWAGDRQAALERLLLEPARRRPQGRFAIAGSMYPADFPWLRNVFYLAHLPPEAHAAYYASTDFTLNITRGPMADMGFCPSGRLFEAASCGTPVVTDWWDGLDTFFEPGAEIVVARTSDDTVAALDLPAERRRRIGASARARVLSAHTAGQRATDFERAISSVWPAARAGTDVAAGL